MWLNIYEYMGKWCLSWVSYHLSAYCSILNERNVPRNCETSQEVAVLLLARFAPAPKICTSTRSLQNGGGSCGSKSGGKHVRIWWTAEWGQEAKERNCHFWKLSPFAEEEGIEQAHLWGKYRVWFWTPNLKRWKIQVELSSIHWEIGVLRRGWREEIWRDS